MHVLIVDDEEAITDVFQMFLEDQGYRVSVAHDGVEALEMDAKDPADAVVTDLTMPRMSGRELINRLHERRPSIPTIVVTGWSGAEDMTNLHTTVMHKPVDLDKVAENLRRLVTGPNV